MLRALAVLVSLAAVLAVAYPWSGYLVLACAIIVALNRVLRILRSIFEILASALRILVEWCELAARD
jgi:hypothetical protein